MLFKKKKKSLSLENKVSLLMRMEQAKDTKLKIITTDVIEQLNILDQWKKILVCDNVSKKVESVKKLWKSEMSKYLPSIVHYFDKYLVDVDLILTPDAFKILYYCIIDDTIYCFEGGTPLNEIKSDNIYSKMPDSIKHFYQNFHNGFEIQGFGIVPFEKSKSLNEIIIGTNDFKNFYSYFTDSKGTFIGVNVLDGNIFEYDLNCQIEYYDDFWKRVNNYFLANFM